MTVKILKMKWIKTGKCFLFFLSINAWGQTPEPSVTVVITPNPVLEGQSTQLRIEVEAQQAVVIFQPTFSAPDFILVGSQPNYGGMQVRKYYSGQITSFQKSFFEYVLSPKKAGNLQIRDIKVKVGDKIVSSPDINVKVLPSSLQPPDETTNPAAPNRFNSNPDTGDGQAQSGAGGQSLPTTFNSDFTVHASLSKNRVYVGEPIILEYWLYDYGDLRQIEVQKWPTFNGFWKDDLEITTRFEFEEVYVKNELMRRAFLARYALYGIKPGKYRLDRLIVRGQYLSNTVIQGFFQAQQIRTGSHGSEEANIEILPLPAEGKPEKFSGAVGQFQIKLEADKSTVLQHSPVTFTVTIQGAGNFQSITNFPIPLPDDFEEYDTKANSRALSPIGMRRELETLKTFQVTAIPRKSGRFKLDPLTWNYFNPSSGTYQKISTSGLEIEVLPGAPGQSDTNSYVSKDAKISAADKIRPLREIESLSEGKFHRWLFVLFIILLCANAYFLFRLVRKRAGMAFDSALKDPFSEAKTLLAKGLDDKGAGWLSALEDSLLAILDVMIHNNARGLTRSELQQVWKEKQLPPELFHRISSLLDKLDQTRFSAPKASDSALPKKKEFADEIYSILKAVAPLRKNGISWLRGGR